MSQSLMMVLVTSDNQEELNQIAAAVVEQHLAACCQISGPIISHYMWEGEPCQTEEWLCRMKTTSTAFHRLCEEIRQRHHYEVPQIVATELTASTDFRDWVLQTVRYSS